MFRRKSVLPRGRYLALTWKIPKEFGGLTNVLLHRTQLIHTIGRRKVEIATLAPNFDRAAARRQLESIGMLDRSTKLRNLWTDIRSASDARLQRLASASIRIEEAAEPPRRDPKAARVQVTNHDAHPGDARIHRRADGTCAGVERLDANGRTACVDLFNRAGAHIAHFPELSDLHHAWFDLLLGTTTSFLINDSQYLAPTVASYRRSNVTTVQVLHNSHLRADASSVFAPITRSKWETVSRMDQFDLVAVLTHRQLDDLRQTGAAGSSARVIPNSRSFEPLGPISARQRGRGVALSRLSDQKQLDHAVDAIARASRTNPAISLDIYGEGELRSDLEAQIAELGAESAVALKGFSTTAREELGKAWFSVLSSKFEGQPLALLEAMASGCIPVAYDIRYGPSDIITDGVDGFLVPAGDSQALEQTILRVSALPEAEAERMRSAAQARARQFSDETVLKLWGDELNAAQTRKSAEQELGFVALTAADVERKADRLTLSVSVTQAPETRLTAIRPESRQILRWKPKHVSADVQTYEIPLHKLESGRAPWQFALDQGGGGWTKRALIRGWASLGSDQSRDQGLFTNSAGYLSFDNGIARPARQEDSLTERELPSIYELTWSFPENFGGLTSVYLHRAAALSKATGSEISLLTLAPDVDPVVDTERLRNSGHLAEGARIRNLWSELRTMDDASLEGFATRGSGFVAEEIRPDSGDGIERVRLGEDGKVAQVDRYRPDGSVYVSDRRDVPPRNSRVITLWDRSGRAVGQFRTATDLYSSWLDHVFAGQPSWLIIDSQFVGGLLHGYQRANVVKAQVIHSSHLEPRDGRLLGKVMRSKANMLMHLENFDFVTTLTKAQANDMTTAHLGTRRLEGISNSRSAIAPSQHVSRRGEFAVVARLSSIKRIDHVIRALASMSTVNPLPTLTIFGSGESEGPLKKLAIELGLQDRVEFMGHVSNAAQQLVNYSYSLLTSTFEGQGLSILESMQAGCVPIAYDIKYGPNELIAHGDTGFLVPAGDIAALAATMDSALALPEHQWQTMSERSRERAAGWSDSAISNRWLETFHSRSLQRTGTALVRAGLALAEIKVRGDQLHVAARVFGQWDTAAVETAVVWHRLSDAILGQLPGTITVERDGYLRLSFAIPLDRLKDCGRVELTVRVDSIWGASWLRLGQFLAPDDERPKWIVAKGAALLLDTHKM